jgi:hypothetical protein
MKFKHFCAGMLSEQHYLSHDNVIESCLLGAMLGGKLKLRVLYFCMAI